MLTAKVDYPVVDVDKSVQAIHKTMARFVTDTLAVWVTGSTEPVPVWSGASRASFLKLAAQARVTITINPVAPSRIPLGIETSVGEVFANPGTNYGWLWSSDLAHIGIVDDRVNFTGAGFRSIERLQPELPELILEKKRQ